MTRRRLLAVSLLLLTITAFAQKDLKSRIESATGGDQAKLAVEYTEQLSHEADRAFLQNNDDQAFADLKEIAKYAKIASEASIQSGKHQKEIEIRLRKIANHLGDVKKSRAFEEQQPVQDVIDAVLIAHDNLLNSEFEKK